MKNEVTPFVKWAGGKASLMEQITKHFPKELFGRQIDRYIEPFVGGGAVLFEVLQKYEVKDAIAIDNNRELINTYNVIKNDVDELIKILTKMQNEFIKLDDDERSEYYYNVRDNFNKDMLTVKDAPDVKRAAYFIFLNRTCFNGLYRVNSKGEFNVPMGKYKNPLICNEKNLKDMSYLIKDVTFMCGDYRLSRDLIKGNTFIYFDPPYRPITDAGFTSYTKDDFNDDDQKELANYFAELSKNKKNKLMLSNSDPKNRDENDDFFDELYKDFNINRIMAHRNINANASGRKMVSEILVTNYNNLD